MTSVTGKSKWLWLTCIISACLDSTGPGTAAFDLPDVRPYVTDEVATQLTGAGHFVLEEVGSDSPHPTMTRAEATEIGRGFFRQFVANPDVLGGSTRHKVMEVYGTSIDWQRITVGPRGAFGALYAFRPLPVGAPNYALNFYGPHYFVPFYLGNQQILVVTVAAHATDLVLGDDGYIVFPRTGGNAFLPWVLPRSTESGLPIQPEVAVKHVAEVFDRRVAAVPRLLLPGHNLVWVASKWILVLDEPVVVERVTGETLTVNRLFVGSYPSFLEGVGDDQRLRVFAAAPTQPDVQVARYSLGTLDSIVTFDLPRLADRPVDFVEVRQAR